MYNSQKWMMRIFALFVFLALLTPFVVFKDLLFPFVTSKAFTLRIMVECAFPFYLFLILSDKRLRPNLKNPLNLSVLAFLIINIISALVGVNVIRSLWGNFERMGGVFYLVHLVALYFYVVLLGQHQSSYLKRFLQALIAAAVLVTINGISGKLGGPVLVQDPSLPYRVSSTFGNPIFFPSFLIPVTFVTVFFALQEEENWKKVTYWILVVLQLCGIYISGTRGALVGLIGGVAVGALVYILFTKRRTVQAIGGAAVVFLIVGSGLLFAYSSKLPANSLPHRLFDLQDTNSSARLTQWKAALKGFPDHPVFGVGPENYYTISNKYFDPIMYKYDPSWFDKPHNYLLEILVTNGALGMAAYLSMLGFALWGLYKAYRNGFLGLAEFAVLVCGLVAYEVQNIFVFDTVSASMSFYIFLGLIGYMFWEGSRIALPEKAGKLSSKIMGLAPEFVWTAFGLSGIFFLYVLYAGNFAPMAAAKNVNYGFAYSSVDAKTAADYFEKAINNPFNFDIAEVGGRYADFAARLPQDPVMAKDPDFVKTQIQDAINYMSGAAERIQNDPLAWNRLAILEMSQASIDHGTLNQAEADLNHALLLVPQRVEILQTKLQMKISENNLSDAVAIAQQMAQINPVNPLYQWQLAMIENAAGKTDNSVTLARQLLKDGKQPTSVNMITWLISYDEKQGNWAEAVSLLEQAVTLSPNDVNLYMNLAQAYAQTGQKDKALQVAQAIVQADPSKKDEMTSFISSLSGNATSSQ